MSTRLNILRLLIRITETSAPYNQLSLALSNRHDITICTYFQSRTCHPKEITVFEGNGSLVGFFRNLKAALGRKDYDIIHVHAPHLGFLFLIANIFMRARFMRSAVYTVHNSYESYKLRHKLTFIPIFFFFRRVICCGNACLESFPSFLKWLAGDKLCVVQNGIDIKRVDRVVRNNARCVQNANFTMAVVGRLIPIKNHLCVLRAFHQSDNWGSNLLFIGEGRLRNLLITESQKLGLGERVKLTGLIPREKVYEHLMKADLFISASRGEGIPIAVLEAMACRCPVLLSDIPPHREVAQGTDFIPLIPPNDMEGFAREIKRFRQMSPLDRAEIGEKCRKLVQERFSLTTMHKRYEEIYPHVIAQYRLEGRS